MQKEVKIVIKIIIFLFITTLYGQEQYVKFDFTKENSFTNKNFIDKRVINTRVYFTRGVETLGSVDEFIFNSIKDRLFLLDCKSLNNIKFISIDNLKSNIKTYVVEISEKEMKVYPVKWNRKEYIE